MASATRRSFLAATAGVAGFSQQVRGRPNILWIIAEDFSPDLGCYGNEFVRTPNLDRLLPKAFGSPMRSSPPRYARRLAPPLSPACIRLQSGATTTGVIATTAIASRTAYVLSPTT